MIVHYVTSEAAVWLEVCEGKGAWAEGEAVGSRARACPQAPLASGCMVRPTPTPQHRALSYPQFPGKSPTCEVRPKWKEDLVEMGLQTE